jgi:misacylated tRNA(Ala) deacylase
MTKELFLDDMYLREFEAEVVGVELEKYIILDQTGFYPKSGGIENDLGTLIRTEDGSEFNVVYVAKIKGNISHEIEPIGLKVGDRVQGKLDWTRRYQLMRYHTAAHVLSGLFFKIGNVKVTGNNMVVGQGRIDFNFPEFDREIVENLVQEANEIIKKDLSVVTYYITRKEMDQEPSLMKLAMGLPASIKHVRIVEITDFDRQPDGGCHVAKLGEIGEIQILKIQNKGTNNRRLYFELK